jgi:hypothetical protein
MSRLPDLSRLSSNKQIDIDLLAWSRIRSQPLLSYFEAVESEINTDHFKVQKVENGANLAKLHNMHLQWLKLCRVPSRQTKHQNIKALQTNEESWLANAISQTNKILSSSFVGFSPLTVNVFERVVNATNRLPVSELKPPVFRSLNASDRLAHEQKYIDWLRTHQTHDAFDATSDLRDGKDAQVAHVVPKAFLRSTSSLLEFQNAQNDPCNVVLSTKAHNLVHFVEHTCKF